MSVAMRTLVHITDLHLVPDGQLYGRLDPLRALERALQAVEASRVEPVALVLSGDLADAGQPEAYRRLRAVLEPCVARLGARVVYAAGNHDDRAALRAELLDAPAEAPLDAVTWVDDLRIVTLDSSVPGHIHGELDDAQLAWLRNQLLEAAPGGTVLVAHHPPIPSPIGLDLCRLRRPERLAAAIAGSDVRIVLSGHSHHRSAGTLGATPVWMAPALAFRYDLLAPDVLRVRARTSFTRVDLGPDWTLADPVEVDVDTGEILADESIGALQRHLAEHEPPTP